MTGSVFTGSQIHHIALRVADVNASKAWFMTTLDFRVDREFTFNGLDFVFLCPAGSNVPVVELVGGGEIALRPPYENVMEMINQPGFNHLCLQVNDLEQAMAELRRRDVKILIDIIPVPPGTGIAKTAFIADPWDDVVELVELA
jgi:catechol 2,3-dioxygenase-like lactoylglutathione lyase family enzyme